MMTTNAGPQLLEVLELCYTANQPVLLVGGHGVGKSENLRQAAKRLGIGCIVRDLSLMEPPDLVGLPRVDGDRTRYLPPSFLPVEGTKGLLIFEELNRCPPFMRQPALQLLTDRCLNDYVLPPGWLPVASINPAGGDYEVADLDPALLSRFVQVGVVANRGQWLAWAREHHVLHAVIEYVESDDTVFDDPRSNPRAWQHVSDLLRANAKGKFSELALQVAVAGKVGPERGAAFFRYSWDKVRPCTAVEVLSAYSRHRSQVMGWVKNKQLDLLEGTLLAVQKHLQPQYDFEAVQEDTKAWEHLGQFFADLPGDLHDKAREFFVDRGYPLPTKPRSKP